MNDFDKYQEKAESTSGMMGRHDEERLIVGCLALGGEVGELQNYIKKGIWHGHGIDQAFVAEELGDILWYIADIASCMTMDLSDIAAKNVDKLSSRYPNGFSEHDSRNRKK